MPPPVVEYWSSIEHAAFMHALVREIGLLGGESSLRFAVSANDYRAAQGFLSRLKLRWSCYVAYPFSLWRECRRSGRRFAIITSNTFYAPGLIARSHHRDVIPVHLMYDLYPDAMIHAGMIREGGIVDRLLSRWMRRSFADSAANVFLGDRLLAYAESRHGKIPRSVVIPVGAEGAFFRDKSPAARESAAKPVIYYGGNLGRMHDVDTFLAALSDAEFVGLFRWRFRGNGVGMNRLSAMKTTGELPAGIEVGGNLPDTEWTEAMLSSDIALVTILPGAEAVVMPSKAYSALVAGQAILAIAPEASDLADLIRRHDCGWVVEPESIAADRSSHGVCGLKTVLRAIAADPDEVLRKRQNAYRAGHEHYDMSVVAKQWDNLLRSLDTSAAR